MDTDLYVWLGSCGYAAANKFYPTAYWIGIGVYTVYATYKFFTENGVLDWIEQHHSQNIAETMKAQKPWIEETREFLAWYSYCCFTNKLFL